MSWEPLYAAVVGDQFGAMVLDPLIDNTNLLGARPGASVYGGKVQSMAGVTLGNAVPVQVNLVDYDQDPTGLPLWFTPSFNVLLGGVQYLSFTAQTQGWYKPRAQVQISTDDTNGIYRQANWTVNGTVVFQTLDPHGGGAGQTLTLSAPVQWLMPGDIIAVQFVAASNGTSLSTSNLGTFANVELVSS